MSSSPPPGETPVRLPDRAQDRRRDDVDVGQYTTLSVHKEDAIIWFEGPLLLATIQ